MSGTYDYWQTRQLNRGLDQAQRRRRRRLAEPLPHEPSLAQLTAEMLHDVLVDRMAQGERAPGPDGIRLSDLSRSDGWEICRQLAWRIKAGKFQPSMARAIRLPKPDGSSRTINIRSIAFGLVAGAVHRILQPKLEARYLPTSYGFRPGKSRWHLLLALERQAIAQGHWVLTQNDIRKAFDNIPTPLAQETFRQHFEDKRLTKLISNLLRGHAHEQREIGIDQGSPLSGDALNLLLHIYLDAPLRNDYQPPVHRFVDNVVVGTSGAPEGQARMTHVAELLDQVGMQLKHETRPMDLREETVTLLGLELQHQHGQVSYRIPEDSWRKLHKDLEVAWETEDPKVTAENLTRGWIEANQATFENSTNDQIDRIHRTLLDSGHRECSREDVRRKVQASTDRWKAFRGKEMLEG